MAFEFDIESMNENLGPFGLSCPEDDVYIGKFDEICRIHHQTMDNILDEVISLLQNSKKTVVSMAIIEALERKLETKAQKTAETPRSAKKPVREPLADRTLATLKATFDEKMDLSDSVDPSDEQPTAALTGKYAEFSPFIYSPANVKFIQRTNAGKVETKVVGSKYSEIDRSTMLQKMSKVEVVSKLPEKYYGGDKSSAVIEAKFTRLGEFAISFREAYPGITDWSNPLAPSAESMFTYGQVVYDDSRDNERFTENTACLMIDDEDGSIVRLDFSNVNDNVTIFPGQIIAVSGTNETGECFFVEKIFSPYPLPLAKIPGSVATEIWCAAGPFTSSENCAYEQLCELLQNVVKEQPNYLILTGPFIDRKNNFITKTEFTLTYDMLMEDLMTKIEEALANTKTEVIIQPSGSRDQCVPPFYPVSPFSFLNKKKFNTRFHFVPDPCVVRLCNGALEVAITSSEVVTHLSKVEYHRSADKENLDRISRLNGHLLSQRSFYPLEPFGMPCSMENSIEVGKLTHAPHIFIVPSVLAPHIKKVNQTVFVNPSCLSRGPSGNYAKSKINLSSSDASVSSPNFSIAEFSDFEILKI